MADVEVAYFQNEAKGVEVVVAAHMANGYPTHSHVSTYVLILVRRGRLRVNMNDRIVRLGKNDAFLILPYQPHRLEPTPSCAAISLCLDKTAFQTRNAEVLETAAAALGKLVRDSRITDAECGLLRSALQRIPVPVTNRAAGDELDDIKTALETRPDLQYCLDDMAEAAHLDKHHLIRKFKKRYGLPPNLFLLQSRVRRARKLMAHPATLTEMALASGFFDQSHFIRHFKRLHLMSPGKYRRALRPLPE